MESEALDARHLYVWLCHAAKVHDATTTTVPDLSSWD